MKKQNVILFSLLAIIAIALTTAFFGRGIDSLSTKYSAKADNSVTIDSETLSKAIYEPFEVIDNRYDDPVTKPDKKFRIPLNDNQYILGAVIFNDCANQTIGNNLSRPMYMDNDLHGDQPNAFNFNIVFGFEHLTGVTLNYFFRIQDRNPSDFKPNCELRFKNRHYEGNSDEDFYNDLTSAGYRDILYKNSGRYYSDTPYTNISYGLNADYHLSFTPAATDCNMLVIQLTYTEAADFLKVGQILMFQIESITFNFECI